MTVYEALKSMKKEDFECYLAGYVGGYVEATLEVIAKSYHTAEREQSLLKNVREDLNAEQEERHD